MSQVNSLIQQNPSSKPLIFSCIRELYWPQRKDQLVPKFTGRIRMFPLAEVSGQFSSSHTLMYSSFCYLLDLVISLHHFTIPGILAVSNALLIASCKVNIYLLLTELQIPLQQEEILKTGLNLLQHLIEKCCKHSTYLMCIQKELISSQLNGYSS